MSERPNTPNLDKLKVNKEKAQIIGDFIDWAMSEDIDSIMNEGKEDTLRRFNDEDPITDEQRKVVEEFYDWMVKKEEAGDSAGEILLDPEDAIGMYLDINPVKLDEEKEALYNWSVEQEERSSQR